MIKKSILKYKNIFILMLLLITIFIEKDLIRKNFELIYSYMSPVFIIFLSSLTFIMFKALLTQDEEILPQYLLRNINNFLLTFLLIFYMIPLLEELKNDQSALKVFSMVAIPVLCMAGIKKILSRFDKIGSQKKQLLFYSDSFSCKNIKQTFYHELGHASVYSLMDKSIDFKLNMLVYNSKNIFTKRDYNGIVEAEFITKVDFMQKNTIEFSMLLCLAGKMSEQTLLKSEGLGGISDYYDWLEYAKTYLSAGHGGTYFIRPMNKNETLINKKSLEDLKEKQENILEEFFISNQKIFHDFYEENKNKQKLGRLELNYFLDNIILHNEMVKIKD